VTNFGQGIGIGGVSNDSDAHRVLLHLQRLFKVLAPPFGGVSRDVCNTLLGCVALLFVCDLLAVVPFRRTAILTGGCCSG